MARKSYSPEFKFAVVLEALKERKTLQEIASENRIAPSQISRWVDEFKSAGISVFSKDMSSSKKIELLEEQQHELYAKIGKLSSENDWLKKKLER
ncbi:MAG: transposase [Cetobacterium sp.]|uniref:transposase n=1 Tax=Cetobacterium sp. TaxID=2071632 RepID=UPI003EE52DFB